MKAEKKDLPWGPILQLVQALAPLALALIGKRKAKEPQQAPPDNTPPATP